MSVFSAPTRSDPWVPSIAALSLIFGVLAAASLRTQDRIRGEGLIGTRPQQVFGAYSEMRATVSEQKKQISDLQNSLSKYQEAAAKETDNEKLLYADLQKSKVMAGIVAVTGPGVTVTLRDARKVPSKPSDMSEEEYIQWTNGYHIHDQDIQTVVNELRAAGAEAISINDQRVVAATAIRCVGPVVQVNAVPTSGSPVRIRAIGDPEAMFSGFTMPGGVKDQYAMTDPSMFAIEKSKALTLPAYSGATPLRWSQIATDKKAQQAQRASETATDSAPDPVSGETPSTSAAPSNALPNKENNK
jgi:uncharacterized protein YlxW (UPF0749 family)